VQGSKKARFLNVGRTSAKCFETKTEGGEGLLVRGRRHDPRDKKGDSPAQTHKVNGGILSRKGRNLPGEKKNQLTDSREENRSKADRPRITIKSSSSKDARNW